MTENNAQNTKIIEWAYNYLSSHGYTLKTNLPEAVQSTPWSYVVRFATSDGYIYLKHTPEMLALEANILQILRSYSCPVPEVIANNAELNCFLMKDAGTRLREVLKKQFDIALFCKGVNQFTAMQIAVAEHADIFIDIGVPDWRLDKFAALYKQLLAQKEILIADGLAQEEINELEKLLPEVFNLCQKLSGYAIKPSIVQPDFNDNNTLIDDVSGNITIIDLGEIAISHPFFSLINCLFQAKKHHALQDADDTYLQLMAACLKNYMIFEPKKRLLEAFAITRKLWFIYGALAHYRLMIACDKPALIAFQGQKRLSSSLREFLTAVS